MEPGYDLYCWNFKNINGNLQTPRKIHHCQLQPKMMHHKTQHQQSMRMNHCKETIKKKQKCRKSQSVIKVTYLFTRYHIYLLLINILLQTSIEAKLNLYSPKRSHLVRNTNVGNRSQTKLASKYLENTMHRDCCHFNFGSIYYCTCVPK